MKGYNKIIISILIIFIVIIILIFTVKTDYGSFNDLVLSNFDDSSVKTIYIIDSSQSNNISRITDDYEIINNLIIYLNTLNLKQVHFRNNNFDGIRYIIALSGVCNKNESGMIMLEINNRKDITMFFDIGDKRIEKKYKITNTEIDYNKLDKIFNSIK